MTAPDPFVLLANHCVQGAELPLAYAELPADKTVCGRPVAGTAVLGEFGGRVVGIWEISAGVSTDVEVDELFIVLRGCARVSFADGTPDLLLRTGSVGRLAAGTATTWSVSETLRKIYIA